MISGRVYIIILIAGISLLGLSLVQGYLIYISIKAQENNYKETVNKTLLDIHHNVEDDEGLSSELISILQSREEGLTPDSTLIRHTIDELRYRIDSISRDNNINLSFDFVIYHTRDSQIYLASGYDPDPSLNFFENTIKAGWRIREELGEGRYRFGLHYYNRFLFIVQQMKYIFSLSILLFSLLIFTMFLLIKAWDRQRRSSNLKNEFINNLAHELKTPVFSMSLIQGLIKEKLNGKAPEEIDLYFSLLEKENNKLKEKIDKVLDMALLEEHIIDLNFKEISLKELLTDIVEKYSVILQQQNGRIQLEIGSEDPRIMMDREHFENALVNLIDNSIKYCRKAPVISIEMNENEKEITIAIKDNGIGIKPDDLKMIFDKYYRVASGNVQAVKGFGIGLNYTSLIVERHSGQLDVDSVPGQGSTFTIRLTKSNHA